MESPRFGVLLSQSLSDFFALNSLCCSSSFCLIFGVVGLVHAPLQLSPSAALYMHALGGGGGEIVECACSGNHHFDCCCNPCMFVHIYISSWWLWHTTAYAPIDGARWCVPLMSAETRTDRGGSSLRTRSPSKKTSHTSPVSTTSRLLTTIPVYVLFVCYTIQYNTIQYHFIISFEKLNCGVCVHSNKTTKQKEKERPVYGTVTSTYKIPWYKTNVKRLKLDTCNS